MSMTHLHYQRQENKEKLSTLPYLQKFNFEGQLAFQSPQCLLQIFSLSPLGLSYFSRKPSLDVLISSSRERSYSSYFLSFSKFDHHASSFFLFSVRWIHSFSCQSHFSIISLFFLLGLGSQSNKNKMNMEINPEEHNRRERDNYTWFT